MDVVVTILVDGVIFGSSLFLVAAGLTLVFGVMGVLNVAHGAFYAAGAYVAATLVKSPLGLELPGRWSILALFASALVTALAVGPLLERVLLKRFYGKDEIVLLLVTYATFLIFEDAIRLIWGTTSYYVSEPYGSFGNVIFGPLNYVGYDFFLVTMATSVGLALWLAINKTSLGRIVLAVAHDRSVCEAMGVNVNLVFAGTFTVGTFLSALGGGLSAPAMAVTPGMGVNAIILSFAVVVIGGLGSIEGAAIGSLVVGITHAAAVVFWPQAELFIPYGVMVMVLLVRPEGLLRRIKLRKI